MELNSAFSITPIGIIVLGIAALLFTLSRDRLPSLLAAVAMLQASAVATVLIGEGIQGITPFNAVATMIVLHGLLLAWGNDGLLSAGSPEERRIVFAWGAFFAWSAISAITLPRLFAGVEVYPLGVREALQTAPAPLRWTLSNLAQAINCVVLALLFVYSTQRSDRRNYARAWVAGLAVALALSLALGLYQRAAMLGGYDMHAAFWGSNPSYNQFFHAPEYGPSLFARAGLPFSEPSYASVWFAAVACAALSAFMYASTSRRVALAIGVAAVIGLVNTLGTSGLIALVLFSLILSIGQLSPMGHGATQFAHRSAFVVLCLTMLLAAFALYQVTWGSSAWLTPLRDAVEWTLLKFSDNVDQYRGTANIQGMKTFLATFGLGAGLGSARASSYAIGLAANVGVIGVVLFCTAVGLQCAALFRRARAGSSLAIWALGALAGVLLGALVGVSDQNWPVLWILVITAFAVTRAEEAAPQLSPSPNQAPRIK